LEEHCDDIKITDVMLGAGILALKAAFADETSGLDWSKNTLERCYHAMEVARRLELGLTKMKIKFI
jgi:hypothetical protein